MSVRFTAGVELEMPLKKLEKSISSVLERKLYFLHVILICLPDIDILSR